MQRFFAGTLIIQFCLLSGCTITEKTHRKSDQHAVVVATKTVVPAKEATTQRGAVQVTFLDTINEGNELVLNENDFDKAGQKSIPGIATTSTVAAEPKYRVQVFASNRIETVREQKNELEKKITEQVIIGYEAPYYKLYTGSYLKRQDAQTILLKLKKLGFVDAWIVSTNAIPEN